MHEFEPLPEPYDRWIAQLLDTRIPRETQAPCSTCPLCADHAGLSVRTLVVFDPRTKCCTYVPELRNFLIGLLLSGADTTAAGKQTVRERIAAGTAVTPLGLHQDGVYRSLHASDRNVDERRTQRLRCPHFLEEGGGTCGVWRHRGSVCATWFCRFRKSKFGARFWGAVRSLLQLIEAELSTWCVLESGFGTGNLVRIVQLLKQHRASHVSLQGGMGPPRDTGADRALWGKWIDRKEEFFERCGRLVQSLTWADVRRLCGPRLHAEEILVRAAFRRMERWPGVTPNSRLQVQEFRVVGSTDHAAAVVTYNDLDVIAVPLDLIPLLRRFDGRPLAMVLGEIVGEGRADVSYQVVDDLLQQGVLLDTAASEEPAVHDH